MTSIKSTTSFGSSSLQTPISTPPHASVFSAIRKTRSCIAKQPILLEDFQPNTTPQQPPTFNGIVKPEIFAYERYKYYKDLVLQAYHDRKIFSIRGNYPAIRTALLQRGWVEKLGCDTFSNIQHLSQCRLLRHASTGNEYEKLVISRMLDRYPTYFIWQPKTHFDHTDFTAPYRNRIKRCRSHDFCTKEGLLTCVENSHWNTIDGVACVVVPKTYRLSSKEDFAHFEIAYKLTQCLSLVNYVAENDSKSSGLFSPNGVVPISCLDFAIKHIELAINKKNNNDIDGELRPKSDNEWRIFTEDSNKILKGLQFIADREDYGKFALQARRIINDAKRFWSTIKADGFSNIWILKPYNKSRGYGIVLLTDWSKIISFARKNCQLSYIVQKYIERPLLVYNTKFDIRQYCLLTTTADSVNIWMYKDCYLRFSSREYNLEDFCEAIHITNNSIQSKYKNGIRNENLPIENMWSLAEFRRYLSEIGKEYIWSDKVYPKMKENVVAVILSSLESMELVKNSFEMYGCDFILTEDFEPILLEVNSTPDMNPTTSVTARICPQVLSDVIKVVIDIPNSSTASTGNYELIYTVPWSKVPSYSRGLVVQGKSMKLTRVRVNRCAAQKPATTKRAHKPIRKFDRS